MASHFALITLCAFVLQVSSQLECPSTPAGPDYVLEPSTLSDTVHLLRTDSAEEARNAALCHVACINYVFANGSNGTNETAYDSNGGLLEPNMISVSVTLSVYLCICNDFATQSLSTAYFASQMQGVETGRDTQSLLK